MGKSELALWLVVFVAFAIRIAFFLSPTYYAEENISAAMALAIERDEIPYRDFFHSHPPFEIYFLSVFRQVFSLPPLLSAKLSSLFISALIVFSAYLLTGPAGAALFSASYAFFFWFSLSIPLLPLSLFLMLSAFAAKKSNTLAFIAFSACATLSEFSGAIATLSIALFFPKSALKGKFAIASIVSIAIAIGIVLISPQTGAEFFSQSLFSQAAGRASSAFLAGGFHLENLSESLNWLAIYSIPLIALSILSNSKSGLLAALASIAALLAFVPGIANNTLQFAVPFFAISAASFRKREFIPAVSIAILLLSIFISARAGLYSERTPGLSELSNEALSTIPPNGTISGTPEAVAISLKTGIPLEGGIYDLTPTAIPLQKKGEIFGNASILAISDYYYSMNGPLYGDFSTQEAFFTVKEPVVGRIALYVGKG